MNEEWQLRLFIAGGSVAGTRAQKNVAKVQEGLEKIGGHVVDLVVQDVRDHPQLAVDFDLLALPTLLRLSPEPLLRVIGDMSDTEKVVDVLSS